MKKNNFMMFYVLFFTYWFNFFYIFFIRDEINIKKIIMRSSTSYSLFTYYYYFLPFEAFPKHICELVHELTLTDDMQISESFSSFYTFIVFVPETQNINTPCKISCNYLLPVHSDDYKGVKDTFLVKTPMI